MYSVLFPIALCGRNPMVSVIGNCNYRRDDDFIIAYLYQNSLPGVVTVHGSAKSKFSVVLDVSFFVYSVT